MPQSEEERNKDTRQRTLSIAAWWNKFHFSGRLIMCSVLFGLGMVLVGGLVFAINIDDDSNKPSDSVNDPETQLPTKAPSRYVGPVIMGIGGFIVVVGIIMCLFETQVCRKKSADSSPLISDKTDPEDKVSDSVAVPSSSNSHKNHRHGARKPCASPKKSKGKHGKSHAKEKNQEKNSSPKSPPVAIEKSKNFMTSSEEKFLTPPNALDPALEQSNPQSIESQESPSLMKSFTSSGPWNQSTEFLTPSTSFKDASSSINDSIEIDERQQQANFKTEYMTPLSVEEERIQKLLIRVRNEQMEVAKREMEEKMSDASSVRSETDIRNELSLETPTVKMDTRDVQNKNISTDDLGEATSDTGSDLENTSQTQSAELENVESLTENINNRSESSFSDKGFVIKDEVNKPVENDNNNKEISHIRREINEKENSYIQDEKQQNAFSVNDASKLLMNESKYNSNNHLNKEITDDENELENSVSSDETVISPSSFIEKSKINESDEMTLQENSCASNSEANNVLESLGGVKCTTDNSKNLQDIQSEVLTSSDGETNDFSHEENISKEDKQTDELPADISS